MRLLVGLIVQLMLINQLESAVDWPVFFEYLGKNKSDRYFLSRKALITSFK
jgi:hypothetical protein